MSTNGKPGQARAFLCPVCGEPTKSDIHGRIEHYIPEDGPPAEFVFLQCDHDTCAAPIVQVREDFGAGYDADPPGIYYPSPRRFSIVVPRDIQAEFTEARRCFDAKAYRATVVMVRRTLEGTCLDQGATKKTLAANLAEMKEQGKIDGVLAEWANLLRITGNAGAHFGKDVTAQDAEDALDFAEALVDHLYVLRARFDQFKARQQPSAGNSQP
ncbi:DUF4145 domain-containing protein [Prescottella agglutinans]|uniref:DUF4145 domain-containing protein n=1 Tax=Prescottella agglutinans TaxID=1644129 RepID=A0A438BBB1_9NOCA|nr:DUF4145 domain-containing protein [Prescottella agglutinans]RVW08227.1 DUF4145 domain-containing protein [Prescottella agglutinans]